MPDNLSQNPLVDKLFPDPRQVAPDTLLLSGFLGKDTDPARWRLYLNPQLTDYMTIAAADILNSEPVTAAGSTEGATRLWVKAQALENIRVESTQAQAEFLRGDIMQAPGGYTTEFVQMSQRQAASPGGRPVIGFSDPIFHCSISMECLHSITFCEIMCHTLLGGYTCAVYKRGQKLHDSLNVVPCAYTFGNDPGCKEKPWPGPAIAPIVKSPGG